jgi:hypothetical protein
MLSRPRRDTQPLSCLSRSRWPLTHSAVDAFDAPNTSTTTAPFPSSDCESAVGELLATRDLPSEPIRRHELSKRPVGSELHLSDSQSSDGPAIHIELDRMTAIRDFVPDLGDPDPPRQRPEHAVTRPIESDLGLRACRAVSLLDGQHRTAVHASDAHFGRCVASTGRRQVTLLDQRMGVARPVSRQGLDQKLSLALSSRGVPRSSNGHVTSPTESSTETMMRWDSIRPQQCGRSSRLARPASLLLTRPGPCAALADAERHIR